MRYRIVGISVALGLSLGCGDKPPTQPSAPPATPPSTSPAAPVVSLQIKVDGSTSSDVIASLSEVVVDASGSTGTAPLTFRVDFGDGTVSTSAVARHVYTAPGTFTIVAAVRDAQGREALSATASIVVKAVTGSWFQAGYVARTSRVEVRRLSIDSQAGTTVRGTYLVAGDVDRAFTGTLIPPRDIRLTAGGVSLEGTLPARLTDATVPWTLLAHGDSADGQRLDFRAITSAPDTPPPDASMKVSFGDDPTAWSPIAAVTPVRIDGASSRGAGLTYFIEFGDGFVATTPQATHVVDTRSSTVLMARVTVVDRFGRCDQESFEYRAFELAIGENTAIRDYWVQDYDGFLMVEFMSRTGRNYVGRAKLPSVPSTPAFATLSDGPRVRIVLPELGLEYEGSLTMYPAFGAAMTVVQHGGSLDGKTWRLERQSYY